MQWEPGAIVARAAPSFLRFGSLEIAKANRNKKLFNAIIDYLMEHFYPELKGISDRTQQLVSLLRLISDRTALMIAHWQSLGFTHGVELLTRVM